MKAANPDDMLEQLKAMRTGARLGELNGAMVLLEPGEAPGDAGFEEMFVKRDIGAIADARTGEIVWPVEDE